MSPLVPARSLLEKDLAHIRREREKASSQRTEQITKLKADLHDVEENTEVFFAIVRRLPVRINMQD